MAVYGLLNNNSNINNNSLAEPRNLAAAHAELAALQRARRNGGAGPGANRNRNRMNFLQQWIAAHGVAKAFAQMHPLPAAPLPNAVRFGAGAFRGGPRLAPAPVAPLPAWILNAAAPRAGPRLAPAPFVGFGLPAPRRNNAAVARAAQQRNNAALARQLANANALNAAAIQQALNANVAEGIQNAFAAGANNGINIPQNVQHAVAAAAVQAAAPAVVAAANENGNANNEIRRARRAGADIAERLVKAKRVLVAGAKALRRGSVALGKALIKQAIKILKELAALFPKRIVFKNYIERLMRYAQSLMAAPRGHPEQQAQRVLVALGAANSAGAAAAAPRNNNRNLRAALNNIGIMQRLPAADPALFNQPGMSANLTRDFITRLDERIPEFLFIKKILQNTPPGWNGRPRPLVGQIPAMLRCLAYWKELDAAVRQRFPTRDFLTPEEWEQWKRFGVGGWGVGSPPDKVWSHDFPTPRQIGSSFVGSPMHYEDLIKILTEAGLRGERLVAACMDTIHHFGEKNRDTIHGCAVAFNEIYRNAARNAALPGGSRNAALNPEAVAKTCVDIINNSVSGGCFDKLVRELEEGIQYCQDRFPTLVEGRGRAPPGAGPAAARVNNSWKGLNYNINVTNRGNLTNSGRMIFHAVMNNHTNNKNIMTANQLWNLVKNKRIKIKREGQNSATVTLSAIQGARRWINNYHRNGYRKTN